MKRQFKVGDIVQDGTFVSSIKKIEGDSAFLTRNYEVKLEKLVPVEIRGGFDNGIVLGSTIPTRARLISPGKSVLIMKLKPYIECDVDEKSIVSIIEANGFKYIHELQDWLSHNAPDYDLRMRI